MRKDITDEFAFGNSSLSQIRHKWLWTQEDLSELTTVDYGSTTSNASRRMGSTRASRDFTKHSTGWDRAIRGKKEQALHQRQTEQLCYSRCMVSFFSLLVSLTFAVLLFGQQGDGPP
jgi:hypothetical protein